MAQIVGGETFTDVSPGKTVTSTRLNNHLSGAQLLNGAVLDQQEKVLPLAADTVLLGDSTLTNAGIPKKVQVGNLLLESQRNGSQRYVTTDTGAANGYVVALAPAATAYTAGMMVTFKAANSNSGASTVNVNGLGVNTIKTRSGGDLAANDIVAGALVELVYDGTNFRMVNALAASEVTATHATEAFRNGSAQYASDAGTANVYAATLAPAATAYTAGMTVTFKPGNANTGASTLNVNGMGVKTIKRIVAGAVADLAANDIQAGDVVTVVYDGTYFRIQSRIRSWDFVDAPQALPGSGAATSRGHGLGFIPSKVRVVLVQTNAAQQQGYNQNDEVAIEAFEHNSTSDHAFAVSADATNVTVAQINSTPPRIIPKGGGGFTGITAANWSFKIYASI